MRCPRIAPAAALTLPLLLLSARLRARGQPSSSSSSPRRPRQRRPNVLLLLTDDQDVLLGGTEHMPLLRQYMTEQGTTFPNFFVHTPVCCPSRSSILSGRYLHNLLMTNNSRAGNCDGAAWRAEPERETFAVAARRAGYRTAFAGKYLNQYGRPDPGADAGAPVPRVPPGWDRWAGLVGNSVYYNYSVVVADGPGADAAVEEHGWSYDRDYLPDLVANRTLESIRLFAGVRRGANASDDDNDDPVPFLIMAAWPTPHDPFTPAPRDRGRFAGSRAPRTPNWNASAAQNAAKHWFLRQLAPIDHDTVRFIDRVHQLRQEALQTIDRHVAAFLAELARLGALEDTVVVYTSDNGFQLGQHRLAWDKRHLYEHDIRVPLVVRGPGVPRNATIHQPVLNIDLAPTIVELVTGSTEAPPRMDGRSFLPLLRDPSGGTTPSWRSNFLVSYHGEGDPTCGMWSCPPPDWAHWHGGVVPDAINNTYHCLRTAASPDRPHLSHTMYCRFQDAEAFVEFYNLTADPWQLHNGAEELDANDRFALEARLAYLKRCSGSSCRESFDGSAGMDQGIPSLSTTL